jgi:hypothetical protein
MSTAAPAGSARDIETEDLDGIAEAPAGRRTRIRTGVVAGVLAFVAAASACQPNAAVAVVGQLGANSVDQAVIDQARRETQLHPFLTCVRQHESDRGPYPHINGYRAKNPRSTASGAYQFLDTTWRNVAPKVGGGQYARAMDAPWWVQDDAAMWMINNGWKSAWNGTGCK